MSSITHTEQTARECILNRMHVSAENADAILAVVYPDIDPRTLYGADETSVDLAKVEEKVKEASKLSEAELLLSRIASLEERVAALEAGTE